MKNISALIHTLNEEKNIGECLDRIHDWIDDIHVVDSYSTDETVAIAKQYTAQVIQHPYESPSKQKNWSLDTLPLKYDWVLLLDADEMVTPELRREIEALPDNPPIDGYWVYRRNYFLGKEMKYGGWRRDKVVRLVRRTIARYAPAEVHEYIDTSNLRTAFLTTRLEHYTYHTIESYFIKFQRYSSWGAKQYTLEHRRPSWWNLNIAPLLRFFRMFIFQLGFLDGRHGYILARLSAMTVFARYTKLWAVPYTDVLVNKQPALHNLSSKENNDNENNR